MNDLFGRTILIVTVICIITLHCAAQTRTGQNTNTISDRVFQNTVLSRRRVPSNTVRVQTIGSPRRSNGERIRFLDITNPSRVPSSNRIDPGISQRLRQISGTQRGTNRVLPTGQTGSQQLGTQRTGSRQLGTQRTSRRVSLVPRRRLSRQMTMARPTGTRQVRITRPVSRQMGIRRTSARQGLGRATSPLQRMRTPVEFRPGPLTRDPRTGLVIQRILARRRRPVPNLRPLGQVPRCPVNTQYMCRPLPSNVDRRRARRCVGNCRTGRCVVICLCACSSRSNQIRRRVNRPQQRVRDQRQRLGQGSSNVSGRAVPTQIPPDLNFTMDSSVLARLLAEPDLNILVGPEGINQILRGEPPSLLPRRLQPDRVSLNQTSVITNNTATIDMGVPIPVGITQSPVIPSNPLLANMLTSGESLREIGSEISTEILRSSFPSLTEFQRPDVTVLSGFNANSNAVGQPPTGGNLETAVLRDSSLNLNDIISPGSRTGALSRDSQLLGNVMRTSGNQEPSEIAIMAAMMQSLGGAVDAISAANARNSSAATSQSGDISSSGAGGMAANQSAGNMIQNFLTGTVKSTDQTMSIPTINECLAQGRELWCDPLGIWESTPGITRWCLTNCRSLNPSVCDENRCECKCVNPETYRRNYINLTGSSL